MNRPRLKHNLQVVANYCRAQGYAHSIVYEGVQAVVVWDRAPVPLRSLGEATRHFGSAWVEWHAGPPVRSLRAMGSK